MSFSLKKYLILSALGLLALCLFPLSAHAATIGKPTNFLTLSQGLAGWWTFDGPDMISNVVDRSGNGNTGYWIGGATTTARGKLGQAAWFDGASRYVNAGSGSSIPKTAPMSIAFWLYPENLNGYPISRDQNNPYNWMIRYNNTGNKNIMLVVMYSTASYVAFSPTDSVPLNTWTHVLITWNGATTTGTKIYLNGSETVTVENGGGVGTQFQDNAKLTFGVGCALCGDKYWWGGKLDDVRIYSRVLSAQEARNLYNISFSRVNTSRTDTTSLTSGLVGHWTFDGKDINWATGIIQDKSGSGNSASLIRMSTSTSPAAGKIGQGLKFDGADDCVNAGLPASLDITGAITVAAWVKPRSSALNKGIVSKSSVGGGASTQQYHLYDSGSNRMGFVVGSSTITLSSVTANNAVPNNQWSHLVGVYNGTDTTSLYLNGVRVDIDTSANFGPLQQSVKNFNIGSTHGTSVCNGGYFDGSIDDVRVYNRALSAAEVKALYNQGAAEINSPLDTAGGSTLKTGLVGYWTFDGKDLISNVADSSGNGNTGYLLGYTATTTVRGKLGQALSFDGVTNIVSAGDRDSLEGMDAITVSAWVNPKLTGDSYQRIVNKANNAAVYSYAIYVHTNGAIGALMTTTGTGAGTSDFFSGQFGKTLVANKWQHVVLVWSAAIAQANIYLNASAGTAQARDGDLIADTVVPFEIGDRTAGDRSFNGVIDDVRVYDRALSANEIKQLYNLGR